MIRPGTSRALLMVVAGHVIAQTLFLGGAFRVDETNILAIARQIAHSPLDPYGFSINWLGNSEEAWQVLANPPLVPYWLAAAGEVFGWGELALRAAVLPFAVAAILAVALLAREFAISPATAAALAAATPAFFLSSHLLLPDMAMVAFMTAAVAAALRYRGGGGRRWAAIGAAAGALAPMAKYNGVVVVLPLAVLALASRERRGALSFIAAAPLLMFGLWSAVGWALYGAPHVLAITSHGGDVLPGTATTAAVVLLGSAVLPWACLGSRPQPPLTRTFDLLVIALAAISLSLKAYASYYPWLPALLLVVFGTLGTRAVAHVATEGAAALRERRWAQASLAAWGIGAILFLYTLNLTSVRYLLPALAPFLILLLVPAKRRLSVAAVVLLTAVQAIVSVAVAWGDMATAELSRRFVTETVEPLRRSTGGALYFDGHWGLQHYAQEVGGVIVEKRVPMMMRRGDILVIAQNADPSFKSFRSDRAALRHSRYRLSPGWPVRTIDYSARANFYGTSIAVSPRETYLPFGFSAGPSEQFEIYVADSDGVAVGSQVPE